jgi:hypothetical protein
MYSNSVLPAEPADFIEDPLSYLPCSHTVAFEKKADHLQSGKPGHWHLSHPRRIDKNWRTPNHQQQMVVDIYKPDEIFGESALLGSSQQTDVAVALEPTKLITWTVSEIEELAIRHPKFAFSLLQLSVNRSIDLGSRIESLSVDSINRRLARSLVRLRTGP